MYKLMMLPLLGILTAGTAMAQTGTSNPSNTSTETQVAQREARLDRLSTRLGLDAQGKAKLEATFARYGAQMRPLWQDAHQTREALRAELAGAKDATRIATLTTQLKNDRAQLQALRTAKMNELQQELTPAQYAQLIVSRHEGRRFHHGRHGVEQ
jgi:Spy/CpxP family protein refolding chaperone